MANINENKFEHKYVSVDQEAWLIQRLTELTLLSLEVGKLRNNLVGASQPMVDGALSGAINGVAIEIVHTLGLDLQYVNIKEQRNSLWDIFLSYHNPPQVENEK